VRLAALAGHFNVAAHCKRDAVRRVNAILDERWTWFAARIGLTSAYLPGSPTKGHDFSAAAAEQAKFGLCPGWLWVCLATAPDSLGAR
jgi:hypothetical protein